MRVPYLMRSLGRSPVTDHMLAAGHAKRLARPSVAATPILAVALVTSLLFASVASAASPGAFNLVYCNPNTATIEHQMEVYRSFPTEYVLLLGALLNTTTGAISYSPWLLPPGAGGSTGFNWSPVAPGNYRVFYAWASWDASRQQYGYSSWYELWGAQLNTYGQETYPGSQVFIGGANGRCDI